MPRGGDPVPTREAANRRFAAARRVEPRRRYRRVGAVPIVGVVPRSRRCRRWARRAPASIRAQPPPLAARGVLAVGPRPAGRPRLAELGRPPPAGCPRRRFLGWLRVAWAVPSDPRAALGRAARGPPAAAHSGAWADVGPGRGGGLGCLDWVRMGLRRSGRPNGRRVPRPGVPSRKPAKTSRPRARVEGCARTGPTTLHGSRRAPTRVSLSGGRSRSPSSWPSGPPRAGPWPRRVHVPLPSPKRLAEPCGQRKRRNGRFQRPPTSPQTPARASPRTRSHPLGSRACGRGRAGARPPGRAGRRGRGRARG
jgi:hypothetical protein